MYLSKFGLLKKRAYLLRYPKNGSLDRVYHARQLVTGWLRVVSLIDRGSLHYFRRLKLRVANWRLSDLFSNKQLDSQDLIDSKWK